MRLWAFDLDGTLVDTSGDIVFAVNTFLEGEGRPTLPPAEVMSHVGFGTPYLVSRIVDAPVGTDANQRLVERFVEIYNAHPTDHSEIYPGVAGTLEELAGGARLAVISNKASPLVKATLDAFDLEGLFDVAWGGGDFGPLKPAPDGILKAMRATGAVAGETTMVGDMPMDVRAGRAAGVRTLFATYGFGTLGEAGPEPDGRIGTFTEILEWARMGC